MNGGCPGGGAGGGPAGQALLPTLHHVFPAFLSGASVQTMLSQPVETVPVAVLVGLKVRETLPFLSSVPVGVPGHGPLTLKVIAGLFSVSDHVAACLGSFHAPAKLVTSRSQYVPAATTCTPAMAAACIHVPSSATSSVIARRANQARAGGAARRAAAAVRAGVRLG